MQNSSPNPKWLRQMQKPPQIIHKIFMNKFKQPPEEPLSTIVFPKGQSANKASLIVCKPKGIPMIESIRHKLDITYPMLSTIPPNTSQIILPINFIHIFYHHELSR